MKPIKETQAAYRSGQRAGAGPARLRREQGQAAAESEPAGAASDEQDRRGPDFSRLLCALARPLVPRRFRRQRLKNRGGEQ